MNTVNIESKNSKKPAIFGLNRIQLWSFSLFGLGSLLVGRLSLLIQDTSITNAAKENFLDILYDLSQRNLTAKLTTSLEWFAIGGLLYASLWALVVIIIDFYNDSITSSDMFLHPRSFHQSSYWVAILGRKILQAAAAIIFICVSLLYIKLTAYCFVFSRLLGRTLSLGENLTLIIVAVAGAFILLYIATVSLRFMFLKRRVY